MEKNVHEHFQLMQSTLQEVEDRLMGDQSLIETQCLLIAVVRQVRNIQGQLAFQRNRIADLDRMACEE